MDIQIGLKVKQLRIARGMTQAKLADASGLTRGYISMLELRKSTMPSYEALSKIARALGVDIKEFKTDPEIVRLESPEEVLRKYQLMAPVSIPVYDHFYVHAGDAALAPIEYIYRARESFAPQNIEAYKVRGNCMEPVISEGDILLIDRDRTPQKGNILLCVVDGEVIVGKLIEQNGELYLKNGHGIHSLSDCQASAVVVEVNKKLIF
ncbi:helix-turn-helix domain-containing protein [Dehalococcoides mccartyi]|uniref:Phage repressor like transcriptional regulator n=1 Tax=Dehalococcoides mccartyi TaxID=61435 RepID=A0AB33HQI5_9CHLR|nr:LexA family transcriptional regulator [Dehalococcoides mccartyi]BAS31201.1 phage repressor like transcriptional regulator [Dehalococcoides mccartyi IBARAKI]BAZ96726.1 phage repressor like transcriptional regulator [Dehalococcoides mccartyi]